jgi:VCBS repeat-containing protein
VTVRLKDNENVYSGYVTFDIIITAENDAPVAQDMSILIDTDEDLTYKGYLLATDIENSSLTYSIVTGASHGTAEITNTATGAFTYTPTGNYYGSDSFTFMVNDGELDSAAATVSIDVQGVNDPPEASGFSLTTTEIRPYPSITASATSIQMMKTFPPWS